MKALKTLIPLSIKLKVKDIATPWTNWLKTITGRDDYNFAEPYNARAKNKGVSDRQVDGYCDEAHPQYEQFRKDIFHDVTELKPEGVILDYGCGTGRYLKMFLDSSFELIGIDPAQHVLQSRTRQNVPSARLICGDMYDNSFASQFRNKVDVILSFGVIQYIPPSRIKTIFRNLISCLTGDGILIIHFPPPKNFVDIWRKHYYHRYRPIFIEKIILRNGMKILKNHTMYHHMKFKNFCKFYDDYYIVAQRGN